MMNFFFLSLSDVDKINRRARSVFHAVRGAECVMPVVPLLRFGKVLGCKIPLNKDVRRC